MRDECLEIKDFATLLEARVIIGDWRHAYNHDRPHSSLHYQAPGGIRCDLHPPAPTLITAGPVNGRRSGTVPLLLAKTVGPTCQGDTAS
jgi:transposase InsO family protein